MLDSSSYFSSTLDESEPLSSNKYFSNSLLADPISLEVRSATSYFLYSASDSIAAKTKVGVAELCSAMNNSSDCTRTPHSVDVHQ